LPRIKLTVEVNAGLEALPTIFKALSDSGVLLMMEMQETVPWGEGDGADDDAAASPDSDTPENPS
jgi:hypothetical protein